MLKANEPHRPAGYYEYCLSQGVVSGIFLGITPDKYNELLKKYQTMEGLGDAVERIARPIATGLDRVLGTHILGCGNCAKRQAALNTLVPFK